jgi:type I restriction-modification system DNA methylase subunit
MKYWTSFLQIYGLIQHKHFFDPACGDGNFLVEVKRRLIEAGHSEQHIIEKMIFGVDLMPDNVQACIERLNAEPYKHNIVCHDALTYDFNFGRLPDEFIGGDGEPLFEF